jgi:GNAT superfamily N-acetyltransferase
VPAIVALLADDPLGRTREDDADPLPDPYWRAFDAIAAQPGNDLFVAESGGAVTGCLQLTIIPGLSRSGMKRGLIEAIRISAAGRGQGLGEKLVRHAVEIARAEGCGLVPLPSDRSRTDAHRFYKRLGFAASHVGMKLALD